LHETCGLSVVRRIIVTLIIYEDKIVCTTRRELHQRNPKTKYIITYLGLKILVRLKKLDIIEEEKFINKLTNKDLKLSIIDY
jgi:hypothetical protein